MKHWVAGNSQADADSSKYKSSSCNKKREDYAIVTV